MNTHAIPTVSALLSKMPSGREVHAIRRYELPSLQSDSLEAMRASPKEDDLVDELSSDDDIRRGPAAPVGAFPGTGEEYNRDSTGRGSAYY